MIKLILYIATFVVLSVTSVARGQTMVYVQNDTNVDITVEATQVAGDPINKKAWKAVDKVISAGARKQVLMINRSGKLNWMDPTPRFIEPGKTAVFTVVLEIEGHVNTIDLKQKLLGTGKSSKMWHSIDNGEGNVEWYNDDKSYQGEWHVSDSMLLQYRYRIFKAKNKTHVEYIFTSS